MRLQADQEVQDHERQERRARGQDVAVAADGDADCCDHPDRGGRREPVDAVLVSAEENCPGAEESNAGGDRLHGREHGYLDLQDRGGVILMSVQHHLVYHSHYAMMWGYPGNIIKITFRVTSSTDPRCAVGTVGRATLYASYNGVRSDSVQFFFPAACRDQGHLYHGGQVNNQVPPL